MSPPLLRTPRTQSRLLKIADAPALLTYRLENREHLTPWEPLRDAAFYTIEGCRTSIVQWTEVARGGIAWPFMVFDASGKEIIASFTFANIVRGVFQATHLGYGIAARHQGKGLMAEALRVGIDYAFVDLDLHRVMANYMPRNERSGRLLERLGFQREGFAEHYLKIHGVWEDHVLTALVRGED
jgi:ribosomal-protein-alanine N-acetyltransferase